MKMVSRDPADDGQAGVGMGAYPPKSATIRCS